MAFVASHPDAGLSAHATPGDAGGPWPAEAGHVLVVDDDPLMCEFIRLILLQAGYHVTSVHEGALALLRAQQDRPALILLDVRMRGMDGHAVCAALKLDEDTRDIPIIFVTLLDDAEQIAKGFALGASDYITKPIQAPVLLARVRAQLALSQQRMSLEHMFRDVIEFAPDGLVLAQGDGRIVRVNARIEQMFGFARRELLGQSVERLIPARLRAGHAQRREAVAPRQKGVLLMGRGLHCLRKDGSEFPADINVSPIHGQREPLFLALVRDASERLRQENQLRELSARSEAVREEHRKHIAREVHDELGQVLTALRMDVSLLAMRPGKQDPVLDDKLRDMKALIDRGIQSVRDVAANLRPAALDMGLVPALEWLCSDTALRTGLRCRMRAPGGNIEHMAPERAVVLFRIAQESMTNVVRHAQAHSVEMTLLHQTQELVLQIRDDGRGFDPAQAARRKTFGLLGMQERAMAQGWRLEVDSRPGNGTTIRVQVPLQAEGGGKE